MVDEYELLQEIEEVIQIYEQSQNIEDETVNLAQNHLERWVRDSNLPTSEGGLRHVLKTVGIPEKERQITIRRLVDEFPDLESDRA